MGSKKFFISLTCVITASSYATASEPESSEESFSSSLSADLVSSYIWRGQDLGGVSIQPGLGIGYRGFSFGAWGSSGFEEGDTKELDLTLAYQFKGLTIGVTDYWFDNGPGYFHYSAHDTSHVYEANIGYSLGFMSINWYTNFAGNDGLTSKGKRAYSSYVELSAPFSFKGLDWSAEVGASPWATSFYNASGFAVINVGVGAAKTFGISDDFGITVSAKGCFNPRDNKGYLMAGVSFSSL